MLPNSWFKKEKPLMGLLGAGGGVGSKVQAAGGGPGVEVSGGNVDGVEPGNGYKYHIFTSPGTLTVSTGGDLEVLLVAGGGGGGWSNPPGKWSAGGGGAGGGLHNEAYTVTTSAPCAITIGDGATGAASPSGPTFGGPVTSAPNGEDTTFANPAGPWTHTALGGGSGGIDQGSGGNPGTPGGCGGGGGGLHNGTTQPNGTAGTPAPATQPTNVPTDGTGTWVGYGNAPEAGTNPGSGAVGGGGMGAVGETNIPPNGGGPGGEGQPFPGFAGPLFPTMPAPWQSEVGADGHFGGGGGGTGQGGGPWGTAGEGGGGNSAGPTARHGKDNTGGGGAGGQTPGENYESGGNGGPGIVLIRYLL